VSTLTGRWTRVVVMGILAVISVSSLYNYYCVARYQREDNRGAGRFLAAHAAPGDVVASSAGYTKLALQYYCNKDSLEWVAVQGDQAVSEIGRERLDDLDHIWLFRSRSYHGDPEGKVPEFFDRIGTRELEFSSSGVQLIKYALNGGR